MDYGCATPFDEAVATLKAWGGHQRAVTACGLNCFSPMSIHYFWPIWQSDTTRAGMWTEVFGGIDENDPDWL